MINAAVGGEWRTAVVDDPLGRTIAARWLLLDDGTAVVEAAEAIGLPLVPEADRDPLRATSRGLGELLLAVLTARPTSLLVGIGGTATVDGGVGMRGVLGSWLQDVPIRVACDVRNPLLGERGRRASSGRRRERTPTTSRSSSCGSPPSTSSRPTVTCGVPARAEGSAPRLRRWAPTSSTAQSSSSTRSSSMRAQQGASLVVTGEGTVDATTFEGKAPGAVLRRCEALGVPCELFGGIVRGGFSGHALSGRRALAGEDLVQLGEELALAI